MQIAGSTTLSILIDVNMKGDFVGFYIFLEKKAVKFIIVIEAVKFFEKESGETLFALGEGGSRFDRCGINE